MIGNELLKTAQTYLNPCLVKLFNAVFTSGIYPQIWSEGYITPIFKAENPKLPQNYRGITICNNIGKVFNSILNNRLDKFLVENNIIHENQIGFSKKSRTSDHIFVLKCILEKYLKTDTKKLFVCFVDFHKAFDTVIHPGIRYKLIRNGIHGLFYRIICNMYSSSMVSIKIGDKLTEPFTSSLGGRQGDVLSPNIFKLFLNDFSDIIENSNDSVYLQDKNISCLLYADDLILISDSEQGLQDRLNILHKYCKDWCMKININKTKVIIFNKSGRLITRNFNINNQSIECVKTYKYLGIMLTASGKFQRAQKVLFNKAMKASYKLYKEVNSLNPNVNTVLHLFDHTICPILLYGCENWGTLSAYKINNNNLSLFETFKDWDFEKLNVKFCKYLLGVNKKSTNIAVLSELGRYPIYLKLITQVLSYWHMLENEPSNLLKSAYEEYKSLYRSGYTDTWYSTVKFFCKTLNIDMNLSKTFGRNKFKNELKKTLKHKFLSYWNNIKQNQGESGKLSTYFQFKTRFTTEKYFELKNIINRSIVTKFRISAHRLRIETGRYERIRNSQGNLVMLDRGERKCLHCTLNEVEDESHMLFKCPIYETERATLLIYIQDNCKNFEHLSPNNKLIWLLSSEDTLLLNKLAVFLNKSFEIRKNHTLQI